MTKYFKGKGFYSGDTMCDIIQNITLMYHILKFLFLCEKQFYYAFFYMYHMMFGRNGPRSRNASELCCAFKSGLQRILVQPFLQKKNK